LYFNAIGNGGAIEIAQSLQTNVGIQNLYLNQNHIGKEGEEAFNIVLKTTRRMVSLAKQTQKQNPIKLID
jgi:hypothetical protein